MSNQQKERQARRGNCFHHFFRLILASISHGGNSCHAVTANIERATGEPVRGVVMWDFITPAFKEIGGFTSARTALTFSWRINFGWRWWRQWKWILFLYIYLMHTHDDHYHTNYLSLCLIDASYVILLLAMRWNPYQSLSFHKSCTQSHWSQSFKSLRRKKEVT